MSELIGLIPAAGRGVRAYPYSATTPKSMLEIDGVPILLRNVELMRDQLGIRDIRIVVGRCGSVISRYFGDGGAFGVRISYVQNRRLDLELPYSVFLASRGIDQPCYMLLADECYVGSNHRDLLAGADPSALITCGLIYGEYAKHIRKNYVVTLRDGLIIDLHEKPTTVTGPLMGTGTYVLDPEVLRRLEQAFSNDPSRGPRDWTTWLASLARSGARISPFYLTGQYVNVNSRDDLNYANYLVRDLNFTDRKTSLIYVIDGEEDAAAPPVLRFSEQPEIDEVVAVARRSSKALEEAATGRKIRLVTSSNPDLPIGELVKLGLDSATGDILLMSYSDDTFAPRDISKLLVYLRDADMVVGTRTTRQMIEQGTNMRGIVRLAHILLAKLLQVLFWRFESRCTDICCVFRGLWRSTYHTIRGNLSATGVEVFPEMVIEVLRARRRIVEIPVNYYNRDMEYGHVRSKYQSSRTFRRIVSLILRRRLENSLVGRWLTSVRSNRSSSGSVARGVE